MKAVCLHDKGTIEQFLRRNTWLHLYELGDLDDFFWQYTTWYAFKDAEEIQELVLLYTGLELPTLLGITEGLATMRDLLQSLMPLLPRRFYAHFSGDLASVFAHDYRIESHGLHYKMALMDTSRLEKVDSSGVVPLTVADVDDLQTLYRISYPENWFDPRMLETGHYYGIRRDAKLVSVAGVHVYSPQYKIGVLGNVTTHPDCRGQRLGSAVCAKLCKVLLETVDHVGLNVRADNASAIACYKRLGFEIIGEYDEALFELK